MNSDGPVSHSADSPFDGKQTMLVLVGLIASGKSTFAEALERHFPEFRRCNQDDLGSRKRVEELAHQTLREGLSPCIDRTNFNAVQRSHWTKIAREFPGTTISVIVFDTPYHVCAFRLQNRTSHPTISNAQEGIPILAKFASDFKLPSPDEGYDHIIYLKASDYPSPNYTRDEILSLLSRLKASTVDAEMGGNQPNISSYFGPRGTYHPRANLTRGFRGLHEPRGSWRQSSQSHPSYRHPSFSPRGRGYNESGTSSRSHVSDSRGVGSGKGHISHRGSSSTRGAHRGRSCQRPLVGTAPTRDSKWVDPGRGTRDDPMSAP
ncbi:P-loop containing nucleoside triphosphate hydrolase protein [Scleroderma citrinum]